MKVRIVGLSQPTQLMKSIPILCLCALFTLGANPARADGPTHAKVQTLDATAKEVSRTMVSDSMMGPRDTLVFYRFAAQHAVLALRIGNQSEKFPVTATVHLFAESVDAEKLDQWINNKHSDGLFPEVPEPTSSHQLSEGTCKVSSYAKRGHRNHGGVAYDDFTVKFKVDAFEQKGLFTLKAFTGDASVMIKQEATR